MSVFFYKLLSVYPAESLLSTAFGSVVGVASFAIAVAVPTMSACVVLMNTSPKPRTTETQLRPGLTIIGALLPHTNCKAEPGSLSLRRQNPWYTCPSRIK